MFDFDDPDYLRDVKIEAEIEQDRYEAAFNHDVSPGEGYVWCDDCGHWYPPNSAHARG